MTTSRRHFPTCELPPFTALIRRSTAGTKFQRQFLRSLGTRYLPAAQGDTGTPNHTAQAAVPAAAVGGSLVIY